MEKYVEDALMDKLLKAREQINKTRQRFDAASQKIVEKLQEREDSLEQRWQQLAVAASHGKTGKCCCTAGGACSWEPFESGKDKNCPQSAPEDYRDKVKPSGTKGFIAAESVDSLLASCAASYGWMSSGPVDSGPRQPPAADGQEDVPTRDIPTKEVVVEEPPTPEPPRPSPLLGSDGGGSGGGAAEIVEAAPAPAVAAPVEVSEPSDAPGVGGGSGSIEASSPPAIVPEPVVESTDGDAATAEALFDPAAKYTIESVGAPGKYLDAGGGSTNGASVKLFEAGSTWKLGSCSSSSQWRIQQISAGKYTIENVKEVGKYLEVGGRRTVHGANVQLFANRYWQKNEYAQAQWRIEQFSELQGTFTLESVGTPGKHLEIGSTLTESGADVQVWDHGTQATAQWRIQVAPATDSENEIREDEIPATPSSGPESSEEEEEPAASPVAAPPSDMEYDCNAGLANWKLGWSNTKKTYCCEKVQQGCEAEQKLDPCMCPDEDNTVHVHVTAVLTSVGIPRRAASLAQQDRGECDCSRRTQLE